MPEKCCYLFELDPAELRSSEAREDFAKGIHAGILEADSLPTRQDSFTSLWRRHESLVANTLKRANYSSVKAAVAFLTQAAAARARRPGVETAVHDPEDVLLPASFIVSGAGVGSQRSFFRDLANELESAGRNVLVAMKADESGSNLKTFLRVLILKITAKTNSAKTADAADAAPSSQFHLKYDLQAVDAWAKQKQVSHIAVAFEDVEAFDMSLLREIIDLFRCWSDRLSFLLVFGIATSAESFYDKLPPSSADALDGQVLSLIKPHDLLEEFLAATIEGDRFSVRLGPRVLQNIISWHTCHSQSIQLLLDTLKYAYLCHFMSNPLSIFLHPSIAANDVPASHYQALRNTPSFRALIENYIASGDLASAEKYLTDDQALFTEVRTRIESTNNAFSGIATAAKIISQLQRAVWPNRASATTSGQRLQPPLRKLSEIFVGSLQGNFQESSFVREMMLTIRQMSSNLLYPVLKTLKEALGGVEDAELIKSVDSILIFLQSLQKPSTDSMEDIDESKNDPIEGDPQIRVLRSSHNAQQARQVRATVVAQKVGLSRHLADLSDEEKEYTNLLDRMHDSLAAFLQTSFPAFSMNGTSKLYSTFTEQAGWERYMFIECILFDHVSVIRSSFMPKSRQLIDRALRFPADYLGCDCCRPAGGANGITSMSGSLPDTSILYQLTLESSGPLINIADLLTAFEAVKRGNLADQSKAKSKAKVEPVEVENQEPEEETGSQNVKPSSSEREAIMAAFQSAFSELVFIGILKRTNKKPDHVARAVWCGV